MKIKFLTIILFSSLLTGCLSDGMPKRLLKSYTAAIELRERAIHFVRTAKKNIVKKQTMGEVQELYMAASRQNADFFDCLMTKTEPRSEACSVESEMEELQRLVLALEQYVVQHAFVALKVFPSDTAADAGDAMISVWSKTRTDPEQAKELISNEFERFSWPEWDAIKQSRLEDELN